MSGELYSSKVLCPVCEEEFEAIKVKSAAIRMKKVDEDFCIHYEGVNPLFYEPLICDYCGYSNYVANYSKLSAKEKMKLEEFCLNKFKDGGENPFELVDYHKDLHNYLDEIGTAGKRNQETAIKAYKLLMENLNIMDAPESLKAKTLLKMGWIYRSVESSEEIGYLKEAITHFINAFNKEDLSKGAFNIASCAYLIGELYRRVGENTNAMEWLKKVLGMKRDDSNTKFIEKARDQIDVVKSSNLDGKEKSTESVVIS